jgi:hypothetical protein
MPRYFRIEEATRLLPEVRNRVEAAVRLKSEFDKAEQKLQSTTRRIAMSGGAFVDGAAVSADREKRDSTALALKDALEQIHALGCQVKDLDIGLIDFPTRFRGREVLLCWKLGEAAIEWWHGLEDGFRGRQPIDAEFLSEHEGDRPI